MDTVWRVIEGCVAVAVIVVGFAAAERFGRFEGPGRDERPWLKAVHAWIAALMLVVLATLLRESFEGQVLLTVGVVAGMVVTYRRALWGLVLYLQNNLIQALLLAVLILMTWGWLFAGLGIPDLIWHQRLPLRFFSAWTATLVLALLGINAFYLGKATVIRVDRVRDYYRTATVHRRFAKWLAPRDGPHDLEPTPLYQFLWAVQLPFLTLLVLPALCPLVFPYVPRLEHGPEFLADLARFGAWCVGLLMGVPAVKVAAGAGALIRPHVPWLPDLLCYLVGLGVWCGGVLGGVLAVKVALSLGAKYKWLSDPFAGAIGVAGQQILRGFAWSGAWLRGLVERAWALTAAGWDRLLGRELSRPSARVWRRVTALWNTLWGRQPGLRWRAVKVWLRVRALWRWFVSAGGEGEPSRVNPQDERQEVSCGPGTSPASGAGSSGSPQDERQEVTEGVFSFVIVVAAFFLGLNVVDAFAPGGGEVAPGGAMFSLLGLVAMVGALAKIILHEGLWYWRFPLFVAVVVWVAWANRSVDKLRYDFMAYEPWAKADLLAQVGAAYFPPGGGPSVPDGLVDDRAARRAWREHLKDLMGEEKPKLVVVCCSGGGARSLAWTTTVLERLQCIPHFDDCVRVIAAGSAGAVGAGYYVKSRHDQLPTSRTPTRYSLKDRPWTSTVPPDSESKVVRSIALWEIWRMFNPVPQGGAPPEDRGKVLEGAWDQLRQVPLEELRPGERAGRVPSLILEPITLEDGRRLLISNLDLGPGFNASGPGPGRGFVLSGGNELLFSKALWNEARKETDLRLLVVNVESGRDLYTGSVAPAGGPAVPPDAVPPERPSDVARTNYSLTAVEFSRAFTRANGFRLATAARMSAALPMFTPAVYLPSVPPLRVIDSGFFDNYGVDVAAAWLFQNREWLRCHTSGVVLVQIRAMGRREDRIGTRPPPSGSVAGLAKGYQLVGSVLEGAFKAFSTGAKFRNDREVAALSEFFNGTPGESTSTDFFTTVVFENTAIVRSHPEGPPAAGQDADLSRWRASFGALTWYLTEADLRSIQAALPKKPPRGIAVDGEGAQLIATLEDRLKTVTDEHDRAALTWDLERAENYERFHALQEWWKTPHQPAEPPGSENEARNP